MVACHTVFACLLNCIHHNILKYHLKIDHVAIVFQCKSSDGGDIATCDNAIVPDNECYDTREQAPGMGVFAVFCAEHRAGMFLQNRDTWERFVQ